MKKSGNKTTRMLAEVSPSATYATLDASWIKLQKNLRDGDEVNEGKLDPVHV